VRDEFGSFDAYLWSFVGGKPIQNRWRIMAQVPARTRESDAMSRDLLRRGFKFVGSTICYALMQATGMVNDHLVTCPQHAKLGGSARRKTCAATGEMWRSAELTSPAAGVAHNRLARSRGTKDLHRAQASEAQTVTARYC
jgi:Methyladenine glycosylase